MFIVVGTTGEYSDRTEWLVAAYWDQDKAVEHARLAKRRTAEIVASGWERWSDGEKPVNAWDADWRADYTGTDYAVAEVPLLEAVPSGGDDV